MMFWYDHDVSGWGWFAMSVNMILFWAVIITAAILVVRALGRPAEPGHTTAPSPEHVLAERFARGEIDEDEFHQRLAALQDSGPRGRR